MRAFFARKALKAFGVHYSYDVSYMLQMLRVSPVAFFRFAALTKVAQHRGAVPREAFYAAKIVGALAEDCGPSVQLAVDMAQEAGMSDRCIQAVLTRDLSAMDVDTVIGFRFADALVKRAPEEDDARAVVRQQWGDAGLVELTLATQIGRIFPMVKTGLGFGKACRKVRVGRHSVVVPGRAA
ncbi:hypothetical protein [Denitrobaculum tricleocarpae]|uniref:Carboxymuconolactone decarboxylase family protein n=1 Tax=Denitrobaculum tricleocarpae TaxID=2591009 RepID=A0A545TUN7_9PROT|nr:hypothetical protein [Denitrobaculum tricleocarpae]TQV80926.1 hypothetical protein FKG95_12340 [Denitrobaculum tricleocarpae]